MCSNGLSFDRPCCSKSIGVGLLLGLDLLVTLLLLGIDLGFSLSSTFGLFVGRSLLLDFVLGGLLALALLGTLGFLGFLGFLWLLCLLLLLWLLSLLGFLLGGLSEWQHPCEMVKCLLDGHALGDTSLQLVDLSQFEALLGLALHEEATFTAVLLQSDKAHLVVCLRELGVDELPDLLSA